MSPWSPLTPLAGGSVHLSGAPSARVRRFRRPARGRPPPLVSFPDHHSGVYEHAHVRRRHRLSRCHPRRRHGRTRPRGHRRRHRRGEDRPPRQGRGAVLRARPARAAVGQRRQRPAALHHVDGRGGGVRRPALRLCRHAAEEGRVRRRRQLRRRGRRLARASTCARARRWWASRRCRPVRRPAWRRQIDGGRRRAGVEPGVPARGFRGQGHAAPRPHRRRRRGGQGPRGDHRGLRAHPRRGRHAAASSPTSRPPSW